MVNFNDPMYGFAPRMSIPSYSTALPPASFAPSVAPMPQQQPRGLLGMLGLGNTGLGGFVDSRRARLAAFGAGLASGRTLGEGLALGAQGAAGARQIDVENATNQQKLSKTREWFQKMSATDPFYADLMQAIDAGMPMQDAWEAAMKHQTGGGSAAEQYGYEPLWAEKDTNGDGIPDTRVPLRPDRGSPNYVEPSLPPGVTGFVAPEQMDRDRAAARELGKDEGYTRGVYDDMVANMPSLETTVSRLAQLSDTATYTLAGQAADIARRELGLSPGQGALSRREYMAVVDNQILPLLRQTFGAQFTVEEGKSLRATLGDPDATPAEKKAVLDAFITQKRLTILSHARRLGIQAPALITNPAPIPGLDAPPAGGGGDIDALMRKYDY